MASGHFWRSSSEKNLRFAPPSGPDQFRKERTWQWKDLTADQPKKEWKDISLTVSVRSSRQKCLSDWLISLICSSCHWQENQTKHIVSAGDLNTLKKYIAEQEMQCFKQIPKAQIQRDTARKWALKMRDCFSEYRNCSIGYCSVKSRTGSEQDENKQRDLIRSASRSSVPANQYGKIPVRFPAVCCWVMMQKSGFSEIFREQKVLHEQQMRLNTIKKIDPEFRIPVAWRSIREALGKHTVDDHSLQTASRWPARGMKYADIRSIKKAGALSDIEDSRPERKREETAE